MPENKKNDAKKNQAERPPPPERGWGLAFSDRFDRMANSRVVSKAIRHLQPEDTGEPTDAAASSDWSKGVVNMLVTPLTIAPLPPTDPEPALEGLRNLPGFEASEKQFTGLGDRLALWHEQRSDLRRKCNLMHALIFSEEKQIAIDFARHYHAFLIASGVLAPADKLVKADGTNDRALDQAGGCKMCLIQNAERLSPEATSELSSRMEEENMVIVASYIKIELKLPKAFEDRFFLHFDLRETTSKNVVEKILEKMQHHCEHNFGDQSMSLEGGFAGPYARTFSQRLADNRDKRKGSLTARLDHALEAVARRQTIRLAQENNDDKETDRFIYSREDLLGQQPDVDSFQTNAWQELDKMIGLQQVKASLHSSLNGVMVDFHRELHGKRPLRSGLCRLFLGPPGTGKTTVGKLYGEILSGFGILSSGEFQVRNATDLIGPYIGHSERQTKQILRDAKGKVLMIDEAYLLDPHRGESARGADPFRQAVIDTIVSEVQNTADEDRCIIMCGYKEPMEQMLRRANPGLARRFPIADAFVFEELDLRQLEQILDHKMEKEEFTMTDEAKQLALDMLQVAKQRTNFGNGGEVDNLLGRAMANYRTRFSQLTADQRTGDVCFEAEDIDPHYRQRSQVEGLIEQSFAGLVDMDDLKDRFNALARRATALRENGRSPTLSMPYHFAFKGPRGSGKRTIAKQMSRLYHSLRLLPIAEVVEVSARDMVAERVRGNYGGKTSKSFEMIEQAMGKVLFISEAHRLAGSGNDQTNMIVRDVREDLVEAVGKPQFSGKVVIILCGDEKPIEWMLDATPGLANRFRISLVFRGLTGDACVELLQNRLQAEAVALTLTEHEQRDLQLSFETLCHAYDWGNSRDIHLITNELVGDVFEKGFREGESPTLTGSEVLKCLKGMYRRQLSRPVHNMLQPRAQIITLGRSLGRENTEEELESVQQFPTVSLTSDNDMSGAFPYDPLLEGHTTRILRLEPAKCRADPIECHLQELNLRDAAKQRWPFNAVSYVWETQSRTKSIRCDGKTMVVRRNCELALQYLRHKQRPVYLWMDSLCINQSDKDEKSRQVLLMGEIFTAAVHVYIWLGVGSEKVTEAVFRLQKLLALRGNWGRYEILRKILIKEYKGHVEDFVALEAVMKHQWWSRMWTFQEFILARRPMFVVGNFQIPWKDFYNIMGDHFAQKDVPREMRRPSWQNTKPSALDRIFPKDEVDDFPQVQVSTHMFPYLVEIGDAIMCRNAYQDKLQDAPKRVYMSHLLLKARNRSAKDSRDKIYGLHYLFEASEYKLPTVDYKISVAKVYEDVTFAILQQSKSWWILSHLFSKRGVSTMELPSWVPDFTTHAIWHQHANLRFQNLNALEEALEKDEKSTKERASHTFRLERTPEGILTNAVFLWTVMAATSEMPSNPTLDYSFDRKFEQTSFELVTDAMEDFLFIFADWLKSMEQTCKSWTDETALNGVIEPEDQPQSEAMKAIACTFERSTWNAFRMVGNLSAEGSRVLPRVLNNVRRCISPDETHPCRICGTKEIHKGNLAVKHFMQWITSQGVAGLENIMYLLYSRAVDHSLVLTSTSKHCQGHFGFCRNLPRPGDEVVLLPGLADPVVVPLKNNSQGAPCYQVIGVTSGMKGPAIRNPAGDGVESSFCFGTCSAMEDSKTHESRSFYLI